MVAPQFIPLLMQLLQGAGSGASTEAQSAKAAPAPEPETRQPIFIQPPIKPEPASLPQGSFTPQRRRGLLDDIFGPEVGGYMRAAGAGMANVRGNPFGDPWITAAQGFGGAQAYGAEQDAAAQQQAVDAEKTAYQRQQDAAAAARTQQKEAADLALRTAAEKRQAKTAELTQRKTLLEIRRMARSNGLTVSQQLEIERIAQAAGENMIGEEREAAIDAKRQELIDQVTNGQGLSEGGLSTTDEHTAVNPDTGQTLVYRDGQWVDPETGEPWGQ